MGAVDILLNGQNFLWMVVAVMAMLGSLAGIFAFCVRKTRVEDAVIRRKKTDEITPDDKVPRSQTEDSKEDTKLNKEIQQTGGEGRTHIEVGSENGVVPVVTEVNKETEAPRTVNGLSEHREEETPAVEEVEEERGEQDERGPPEHGIQEVNRREECSRHPEDQPTPVTVQSLPNGSLEDHTHQEEVVGNGKVAMVNGKSRWSFPPLLADFDLMETDADPTELEQIFADERLAEIYLELDPDSPGLGISIVGGSGSPSGDLPIIIKRVLPNSLAERDGRLKSGDELIAVNETLLVGVAKDIAIETLSNISGNVRLLVLQDE